MNIKDFSDANFFAELLRRCPTLSRIELDDPSGSYVAASVDRRGDLWYVNHRSAAHACSEAIADAICDADESASGVG